jgi:eukaryotic-like serine/threonine-protein kinase
MDFAYTIQRSSALASLPAFAEGAIVAGKYRIDHVIAEGGSGIVVAATHLALHQSVAIKYLKPAARANPDIVERFAGEGRLAAQITSEHVVRVYDVGELADEGPYIVMEHLRGRDLAGVLQEGGPLPVARAIDFILQACDALAYAHALDIVHRDIKPENLILAERTDDTPVVKIIDFGISKSAPRRGDEGSWRQTAERERFGTPIYMSPEQLRSTSGVDARSDIWSVGVLLHELLTCALPFEGESLPQLCVSILNDPPVKLRSHRPDAPPELEAIVLKCLEKDPARRFRNVAELAQALAPFGPPKGYDRAERIKKVLRRAGKSVRPPLPRSASLETFLPGELLLPVSVDASRPEEAQEATATDPVREQNRASTGWKVVVGALVLIATASAGGVLGLARGARSAAPPEASPAPLGIVAMAAAAVVVSSAAPTASVSTPVFSPSPDVPTRPPSSSPPVSPSPSAARPRPSAHTLASTPAIAASANGRSTFGDRK